MARVRGATVAGTATAPGRGFVPVPGQVCRGELTVARDPRTGGEAPDALDGVSVNLAVGPSVAGVVYPVVDGVVVAGGWVGAVRVGVGRFAVGGHGSLEA